MTDREKKLREFGFKPVEDPILIEAHKREWEETVRDVTPVINALTDWVERSKNEVVARC